MEKEEETKLSKIESQGMINFAYSDKIMLSDIGNVIYPDSILMMSVQNGDGFIFKFNTRQFDHIFEKIKQAPKKRITTNRDFIHWISRDIIHRSC